MNRPFLRFPDIKPNFFSIILCLSLIAVPCLAWANATNFRDMSNSLVVACRLPPPLITQLLWLMSGAGALAMVVSAAYAYRSRKHSGVLPKRYALAAMLPFYIAPVAIYLILAVTEGFGWGPVLGLLAILGVMTLCLSPVWLGVAAFHRRLLKRPEAERARSAKFGFAALGVFTLLTFYLPYTQGMLQTAPLLIWLLGAGVFVLLLVLAFRDSAGWRRAGAAVLVATVVAAAVLWWDRNPYEAADFAHAQRKYAEAIEMVRPLALKFDVEAAYRLGKYLSDFDNPKADYEEGIKWYTFAGGKGHAKAAGKLAFAYLWGWNGRIQGDDAKAAHWLEEGAKLGHAGSQSTLGQYYMEGKLGFPQDMKKAQELLEAAAKQGEWYAPQNLYWLHRRGGPGMQPNYEEAYYWYLMWGRYGLVGMCPNTVESTPGQTGPSLYGTDDGCVDAQLAPLLTPAQIEAAKARFKDTPKPPEYNAFFE